MSEAQKTDILFFNSNIAWGGGEKWHLNMACALRERGHSCLLITNIESELGDRAEKKGFRVIRLKVGSLSFLNPFKIIMLYNLFKKLKTKNIIMNLPSDVKLCAPSAKLAKVENVLYRRGMPNPLRSTILNKFIFSKVDLFIANSQEIKKSIIQNIPELEDKTTIIFNGVETDISFKKKENPVFTLGNLGRLVEQKGQHHLIEVARILKEKDVSFKLVIGGSGPLKEELSELIKNYSLSDCVDLLGLVNPKEFFEGIDLFVFSSHFEGSANALIESLQFSVPSIAFDTSSNPEVIRDGESGFLIPPFDEKEFANKIIELMENEDLYRRFQKNGRSLLLDKFDYTKKVQEVETLLK